MTEVVVKTGMIADENAIIDVITLAFSTDPVFRWLYPDPHRFLENFPTFARAYGGRAFEHGSADYADGYSGAPLWLPPDVHSDDEALGKLLERSAGDRKSDVLAIIDQEENYHPGEPHWHLIVVGVDPTRQGKGIGSALMKQGLVRCDRDSRPTYLDSTNPKNIPLYGRYGFELLGTIEMAGCPPIYPMLRKPRPALRNS